MAEHYKNTYQRYAEAFIEEGEDDNEDIYDTEMYVTDLNGKMHNLSGNIEIKLTSVRNSMEYWRGRQDDDRGKKFYANMRYLYQQILLFLEGREVTA